MMVTETSRFQCGELSVERQVNQRIAAPAGVEVLGPSRQALIGSLAGFRVNRPLE